MKKKALLAAAIAAAALAGRLALSQPAEDPPSSRQRRVATAVGSFDSPCDPNICLSAACCAALSRL